MPEKVRIGILGCANIAEKYSINAFKAIDNAEVVCIASRDPKKAEECAERHGITAEKSYDAVLQRKDIDAVYIPLPIGLHEEWSVKAALAGKHVLCEKSLAHNLKSARNIIDTCKSQGVVLYEDFMCSFHPQHAKVLSLLHDGAIGNIFVFKGYFGHPPVNRNSFRYNPELGGGSLNEVGCYPVFMARKMLEANPVAVTCSLTTDNGTGVDIQGTAYLEFPNGRSAFCAFGFDQVYQNNYTIWGSRGFVRTNRSYSIPANVKPVVELLQNDGTKDTITQVGVEPANHFELIFRDFCETVSKKDKVKILQAYNSLLMQAKVMEALRISAREDRKVELGQLSG